jgi:hypothetical protein
VVLVAIAFGCSTSTRSSNVRTRGFFVEYTLVARPNQATVARAQIRVEGESGTALELVDGDALACDGVPLLRSAEEKITPTYVATLPADKPLHTFVLSRAGEADASESVPAPAPLQITNDPLDGTYASLLRVSWGTPASTAKVSVKATSEDTKKCAGKTLADAVADTGSFVFAGAMLEPADKSTPDCTYALEVTREETSPASATVVAGGKLVARGVDTSSLHIHGAP